MADATTSSSSSNSNGSLKRQRSTSPVGGGGEPGTRSDPSVVKKQNTGHNGNDGRSSARMSNDQNGSPSTAEQPPQESAPAAASSADSAPSAAAPAQAAVDVAAAPSITIRALIVTQDASIIIGKAGSHIKEIRERAGAKVSVSEQIPGNPERILHVTGPLDAVSKAYGLIVRKINDEPYDVPSVPGSRAVTIKYIVPNNRMGSVIGKGGSKIKEIQEASGARLQASESMLPGSTERILSVSGVADAVHIAVYYVGTILQETPERATANTPYRPTGSSAPAAGSSYVPGGQSAGAPGGRYGGPSPYNNYGGAPAGGMPAYGYGGAGMQPGGGAGYGGPAGGMQPGMVASTAAAPGNQTQQIYVPNELVGNIIGKGGAKINEIRQLSGCQIKIMEATESQGGGARQNERLVTITGLPPNIQTAVQMLHSRLELEKQEKQRKMQAMGGGGY